MLITHRPRLLLLTLIMVFSLLAGAQPVANFTANKQTGCAPFSLVVTFQDQSVGATSWLWNFGDPAGNTSTLQNPTFVYSGPGCYDVTLTATNAQGSNTIVQTCFIEIFPQPVPAFSLSQDQGCVPLSVTFSDISVPNAASMTSWVYILSDGSTSNSPNPTFTFPTAPDTISVALTVTNSNGCQATQVFQDQIITYQPPTMGFTVNANSSCNPPLTVNFTNTTVSNGATGITYNWSFPGGSIPGGASTFTGQTPPPVTYVADGQYDVTLTLVSANGCADTLTVDNMIGIGGVTADFVPSVTTICEDESVTFTNQSSGGVTSYAWNFGVTSGVNSTDVNPVFTYNTPGVYSVTLQAINAVCGDTLTQNNLITVLQRPIANYTINHYQDCQPGIPYVFTNISSGGTSFSWDFGDGTPVSTQANPTHTFTSYGNFIICLTATNALGCTDVFCDTVRILQPNASFIANPTEGCVPLLVNFSDNSSSPISPIVSWQWTFGSPAAVPPTATIQNPAVNFTAVGNYNVRLIIVTQSGCRDTVFVNNAVRVGNPPQVAFTSDKDTVCINEPLTFTSTFADPDWQYYWDFQYVAPGSFSLGDSVAPTAYSDTGTYSVALIIEDNGCRDTAVIQDMIFVSPPLALFGVNDSLFCSLPASVVFTDQSVGPIDSYRWLINGIPYSTLQTPPPLTVPSTGTYTVQQIVSYSPSGCTDTFTVNIRVSNPVADFTVNDAEGCYPHAVTFTAAPIQNSYLYSWLANVQPGVQLYSNTTQPTFSFTYQDTGVYTVRLIARDLIGCRDTLTRTAYVSVIGPYAAFTSTPFTGCPPLLVQFDDATVTRGTTVTGWSWTFGDGGTATGTPSPTHSYTTADTFGVNLTVTDNQGCTDQQFVPDAVRVTFPIPSFTVSDDSTCAGNGLVFTSTSSGVGMTYAWNFGDGTSDVGSPVTHAFPDTGFYDVELVVTDVNGCQDSITLNDIVFIEQFEANFGGFPRIGICPPLSTQFSDSTIGNVVGWNWNFGDGFGFSILQNPGNVYLSPGYFDVRLVATHEDGCRDTVVKDSFIFVAGPNGTFTIDPPNACLGDTFCVTATVTGATVAIFDFRDGVVEVITGLSGIVDTVETCHVYQNAGSYSPIVVLQDLQGCVFTLTIADSTNVYAPPQAVIGPQDTVGCTVLSVQFQDLSIPGDSAINSWIWSLGDGDSAFIPNPFKEFSGDTIYQISLIVTDINGCTDTTQTSLTVYEGTIAGFTASDTLGCAPLTITFSDNSTNLPPSGWSWDFGDGTTTTGVSNPTHTYQNDGIYTVTLIVADTLGCTDTLIRQNYIRLRHPEARIYSNSAIGCNPVTITFYADSTVTDTTLSQYEWCLTEVNTGTQVCSITSGRQDSLNVTFPIAGQFNMTVTVTDALGCTDISDPVAVTIVNRQIPEPVQLVNVSVTGKTSGEIRWNRYPGTDFVQYAVYRLNGPTPGIVGTITIQDTLRFVENNPALDFENNSYCYEVLVQNFCLEYSRADQTVDHCTIDLETTPGIDQIILNWSPYVGFPVGQYEIYRANTYNPNIPPLQIGVQPGTSLTFIDRETFCRDSISYRILAQGFGAITQRSFSDLDANAPIHPAPVLAADMEVATLVGDDTISTDSILVRWGEYTGYRPAAYILQKSEDGQNWSVIDTFGLAIRSYLDTDVDVYARSYYYRVFALDECGDQSVEGLEGRSILLRVQLNATGRIPLLTWTPYERWGLGVRNYQIEIYNEATGQWEAVDITPSSVRQYGDERSDLNQATYCYRIRAVEVGGTNAESVSNAECVTFGPAIFAPNAFSPNNDGHNDRFNVYVPNSRFAEITIFNRWGEQIYYSPDPQEGWDGTYKGQAVQEGVYLFVVRVTGVDGQPYERSGTITLIR